MEYWDIETLKYSNDELMECWIKFFGLSVLFIYHSNTPVLRYSITPFCHYSITPSLQYSGISGEVLSVSLPSLGPLSLSLRVHTRPGEVIRGSSEG